MGSQPSAPTLDTKQSSDLLRQQLAIQREELPAMAVAAGNASRQESRRNINFGLRLLGDQRLRSSYEAALPDEMRRRTSLLGQLDAAQSAAPEYTRLQEQLQGAVGERAGMLSAQDARDAIFSEKIFHISSDISIGCGHANFFIGCINWFV